jgi:hypothetical protein
MKVGDTFHRSSYFTPGRVKKKNEHALAKTPFAKGIQTTARGMITSNY